MKESMQLLGWTPRSIEETITDTAASVQSFLDRKERFVGGIPIAHCCHLGQFYR